MQLGQFHTAVRQNLSSLLPLEEFFPAPYLKTPLVQRHGNRFPAFFSLTKITVQHPDPYRFFPIDLKMLQIIVRPDCRRNPEFQFFQLRLIIRRFLRKPVA